MKIILKPAHLKESKILKSPAKRGAKGRRRGRRVNWISYCEEQMRISAELRPELCRYQMKIILEPITCRTKGNDHRMMRGSSRSSRLKTVSRFTDVSFRYEYIDASYEVSILGFRLVRNK